MGIVVSLELCMSSSSSTPQNTHFLSLINSHTHTLSLSLEVEESCFGSKSEAYYTTSPKTADSFALNFLALSHILNHSFTTTLPSTTFPPPLSFSSFSFLFLNKKIPILLSKVFDYIISYIYIYILDLTYNYLYAGLVCIILYCIVVSFCRLVVMMMMTAFRTHSRRFNTSSSSSSHCTLSPSAAPSIFPSHLHYPCVICTLPFYFIGFCHAYLYENY